MSRIMIVSAGQSGLMVAHSLLDAGYEVDIINNRTLDEIGNGRVASV